MFIETVDLQKLFSINGVNGNKTNPANLRQKLGEIGGVCRQDLHLQSGRRIRRATMIVNEVPETNKGEASEGRKRHHFLVRPELRFECADTSQLRISQVCAQSLSHYGFRFDALPDGIAAQMYGETPLDRYDERNRSQIFEAIKDFF